MLLVLLLLLAAGTTQAAGHGHKTLDRPKFHLSKFDAHRHKYEGRGNIKGAVSALQGTHKRRHGPAKHHGADARRLLANTADKVTSPIRIHVEYQEMDPRLSADQLAGLDVVVSTAVRVVQRYLGMVYPVNGSLLLPPICSTEGQSTLEDLVDSTKCSDPSPSAKENANALVNECGPHAHVNRSHIGPQKGVAGGPGEETDFYLYVTSLKDAEVCIETDSSFSVVAYASMCSYFVDLPNRQIRPGAGYTNICPNYILAGTGSLDKGIEVVTHELLHALGFTSSMFKLYTDSTGAPRDDMAVTVTTSKGSSLAVTAPEVLDYAKTYFKCPSLEYVRLEDEGGNGTAGSHWEYTLLQGDVMMGQTPFAIDGSVARISPFTLRLLMASGWYQVDLAESYELVWGKGAGCTFTDSCSKFVSTHPNEFFCSKPQDTAASARAVCDPDDRSQVVCAGKANLNNACPMWSSFGDDNLPSCLLPPTSKTFTVVGSSTGPTYRCVQPVEDLIPAKAGNTSNGNAICYPATCNAKGELSYTILNTSVACPTGAIVDLTTVPKVGSNLRSGSLECPDNEAACATLGCPGDCSGQGTCLAGKCTCRMMYMGADCSVDLKDPAAAAQNTPPALPGSPKLPANSPPASQGGSGSSASVARSGRWEMPAALLGSVLLVLAL